MQTYNKEIAMRQYCWQPTMINKLKREIHEEKNEDKNNADERTIAASPHKPQRRISEMI